MDYQNYLNSDGTYTSPKNGKVYKTIKAFIAHWYCKSIGGWKNAEKNQTCQYCKRTQTNQTFFDMKKVVI
jgi:hypothetical protein